MSEFGIRTRIFQAGSIHEVSCGVRQNYDQREAMLSNSLFVDFLKENGLKVTKGGATRDIICIDFKYGSSSYEEAVAKLSNKMAEQSDEEIRKRYQDKIDSLKEISGKFEKKSKEELRELFYQNGVDIQYPTYNKSHKLSGTQTIRYRMLYRSPGKAKTGSCMFIRDSLYKKARSFLYMGVKLPKKNAPIIEFGAYSSLVASTIESRIQIPPENILILKDVDSFMRTNVISVEINERHECVAVPREFYEVSNEMFDGQALIDESVFPDYADGYILLRQHFTKCAAFCTKIQKFFHEYYGDAYETATITDMFGVEHAVKDIVMITTNNATKWEKYDISYEYWSDRVRENGSMWGIVKTAHKSKLGDVQRMSYQMVNALDSKIMDNVLSKSKEYIADLKLKDDVFLEFLKKNSNFSNDFDAIVAICEQNPMFTRSEYFRGRKKAIISNYVRELKNGRIIQNADNLTIVGSPYALLMYSVGLDPKDDPTFEVEDGCIQCWTDRFDNGETLAAFRSPFNSQNNLNCLHNHYHEFFDKYFRLGSQIIAINMNGTDFQCRNNGSDQDSDSIYTTNQPDIAAHAAYCVRNYPTIVNNIPKSKNIYTNSPIDFARVDNNLAHSQRAIGESSNLAQICLSYGHTFDDRKYKDYACILAVVA